MRRRCIYCPVASFAVLAVLPGSLPAADNPPTATLSIARAATIPQQASEKMVWVKVKVRHAIPSQMTDALKQEDMAKLGIKRVIAYDSDSALLVQGTSEGIEALRERVKALDTPPEVIIKVAVYRYRLSAAGNWRKELSSAPMISTLPGSPVTLSATDAGYGIDMEVIVTRDYNGSLTLKAKGGLLLSKDKPHTARASTASVQGRVGSGTFLRLLLAPPGQSEKALIVPDASETSVDSLKESGITSFYMVEITSQLRGEQSTSEKK